MSCKVPQLNESIYLFNPVGLLNIPTWREAKVIKVDLEEKYFETDYCIKCLKDNEIKEYNRFSLECFQIIWFETLKSLPLAKPHYDKYFK